jgi:hypothetical protein
LIFKRCEEGSAKWAERLARIAAEGNRKKSEAVKSQPRDAAGRVEKKPVVDHRDPPSAKRHVAREARAAEAKVSPATMPATHRLAAVGNTVNTQAAFTLMRDVLCSPRCSIRAPEAKHETALHAPRACGVTRP